MKDDVDPDELLLRWCRSVVERAIRSNPGREDEVRQAFRRAMEPHLPEVRATLAEILATSVDPEETAKAAVLLDEFDSRHGGGTEA